MASFPLNDRKICRKCQHDTKSGQSTKMYTRNELVIIKTTFYNYHKSFYITEIQKLVFHIPYVQILGTNHCGDSCRTEFKPCESFEDFLCCRDYAESLVASFAHQTQSEYYGGSRSVSIEGIALEHFSALP